MTSLNVILCDGFGESELPVLRKLETSQYSVASHKLKESAFWKDVPKGDTVVIRAKNIDAITYQAIKKNSRERNIDVLGLGSHLFLLYCEEGKSSIFEGAYSKSISVDVNSSAEEMTSRITKEFGRSTIFLRSELGSIVPEFGISCSLIKSSSQSAIEAKVRKVRQAFPKSERVIFKAFDMELSQIRQQYRFVFISGHLMSHTRTFHHEYAKLERFADSVARKLIQNGQEASFSLDLVVTKEGEMRIVELKSIFSASLPDIRLFYTALKGWTELSSTSGDV